MFPLPLWRKLFLGTLLCLAVTACGKSVPIVDRPAPEFTLDLLEGGQLSISELRGKPVILYFFASW